MQVPAVSFNESGLPARMERSSSMKSLSCFSMLTRSKSRQVSTSPASHRSCSERKSSGSRWGMERTIVLLKERRDAMLGIRFAVSPQELGIRLPTAVGCRQQAVVLSVTAGSSAALAGLSAFDVVTKINGKVVSSPWDALKIVRRAIGPLKISVRCCPARLRRAADHIQQAWRSARGIIQVVCLRPTRSAVFGLRFEANTPAARIAQVTEGAMLDTRLHRGDIVLSVNNVLCTSGYHAASLLRSAPCGKVVLLCKRADATDQAGLDRHLQTVEAVAQMSVEENCAVCFEPMSNPVPWLSGCGHHFCKGCDARCKRLAETCPVCRATQESRSLTTALIGCKRGHTLA